MLSNATVCFVFTVSPSSPAEPETAADAPVIVYVDDDPHSLLAELSGKQIPLDHSHIAHFILSLSCIRFSYCTCLLLSHA